MDPNTTDRPVVALPTTCARVKLPLPPNFLQLAITDATIPVASLAPDDAVLLALALARNFLAHHRRRWEEAQRLSLAERQQLPHPSLVHPGIVERIARETCEGWGTESAEFQTGRREGIAKVLNLFLEEVARG